MTTTLDWAYTNVCLSPALISDADGLLKLQPFTVPRVVADVVAKSGTDGKMYETISLPGKLMMDQQVEWYNDTPLDHLVVIRVSRDYRSWVTSNPNAIQIRDRWTTAIDTAPSVPEVTGVINSQVGSAIDLGTNSVVEPQPGRQWVWMDAHSSDELIGPIAPGQTLRIWYRCYVWTPPPWSNNANKSSPQHEARSRSTRIQLIAHPRVELSKGLT